MPVDFTKFQANVGQLPTYPRDVFAALSGRSHEFGYLRDVQGQVLDSWYERRNERDVVIKMNTGTGKTTVGLLALRSCINEGRVPALYVTPNNFLTDQVRVQAESLGIACTEELNHTYLSGEAIGIVNIHRLVNSRSIFGGPGSYRIDPTPISCLVIDDAHACVRTIEDQTSVKIRNSLPAYTSIFELLKSDLAYQSQSLMRDLEEKVPGTVLRVPISAWATHSLRVMEILDEYRDEEWIKFNWDFIRDILTSCQAIFSSECLEIKPLCPPTNKIWSLENARHRLYLTATLANDSILITHFGVSDIAAQEPITPDSAADIGDRLILSPFELDPNISEIHIREMLQSISDNCNVVVLVPSERRSRDWEGYADHIVYADEIASIVSLLKSETVGLVVFVNKYDGIDLPDDACRVLVIDGLPEAVSNSERREAELLGGSDFLDYRKLQRIEQGMGRGVRSVGDYCVVLLLGSSLSAVLAKPHMRNKLGPAARAQLELSMAFAPQISGQGIDSMVDVIKQCLSRDDGWLAASRSCLTGVKYGLGSIEPFSVAVRNAFVDSTISQFQSACEHMSEAVNLANDSAVKGWLQEQLATYMHMVNEVSAQNALAGAIRLNPRVMKPLNGVGYKRILSGTDQAIAVREEIDKRFGGSAEVILGFRCTLEKLIFNSGNAAEFENAFAELGVLLGFVTQRPERDTSSGPDVLWVLDGSKYLVIECKSEAESNVWKKDAAQLAHSISWFKDKYDSASVSIPLLVHHSGQLEANAVLPPGTRILDNINLQKLRNSIDKFANSVADTSSFVGNRTIVEALQYHGLGASSIINRYTTSPSR